MNQSAQLPPQLSTFAPDVDWMYLFLFWLSVASFVAIVGVMVYFVFRYRRRPGVDAVPTGHGNTALEIAWTFLPLILLVFLFHEGFRVYVQESVAPQNTVDIHVRGMQWNWEFTHSNGVQEFNQAKIPVHTPVRMIMSSSDVLHSFYVPDFRIKRDVVPGMYSTLWFEATELSTPEHPVRVFCAEYCGAARGGTNGAEPNTNHSTMMADLHIIPQADYASFLREAGGPPAECAGAADDVSVCWGQHIYEQNGCRACHGVDGATQAPGPNWKGLFGHDVALEGGASVTADEAYIRRSILEPQAQIVRGFGNVNMPPYHLRDQEIDAVIAYMRSLDQ